MISQAIMPVIRKIRRKRTSKVKKKNQNRPWFTYLFLIRRCRGEDYVLYPRWLIRFLQESVSHRCHRLVWKKYIRFNKSSHSRFGQPLWFTYICYSF